ncbi:capsule assembly Wzi family protein [Thalassotalea atypica]|uniref:capsule assembly Wzi family protein n=1 Tax=Thalassotalea atypica TaxID=2054316 RepID=UPI00257227E1|nr:capsule assembly Wzi family protein [Thalassotalea atypica]
MFKKIRKTKSVQFRLAITTAIISLCPVAHASPWVDTSNIFLRANIQQLADAGIIKTPVTTFPLMWNDIAKDLTTSSIMSLPDDLSPAYHYVRHQLKLAKKNRKSVKANLANQDKRFTSFGEEFRDKNNIQVNTSFLTDRFAFKISTNYTNSPSDGDEIQLDGSYGAFFIGNWVFTAGMQDRWWGPTWDSSLSLTNNARPIPALTLSRKSAIPLTVPFTEIDIPWTVTTFMGQMDDNRVVNDTLLWGFRLNFKPTEQLEVGVTRLAQWAGDGRPSDLSTFIDVLKGLDNCGGTGPSEEECAAGQEPGNQLAGYDIRYSMAIFDHPFAVSFTSFAEDGDSKGGLSILGEERYQIGLESQLHVFNQAWKVYIEGADTYATCRDGRNGPGDSTVGDCYYEHHIYQTGMRYNGRSVGNLYENDATSLVAGAISQSNSNTQVELKFRWLQLNKDNHDKAPETDNIGNTLTSIAENLLMVSGKVQHSYRNWRFTLGSDISQSSYDNDLDDDTNFNIYANVEVNL